MLDHIGTKTIIQKNNSTHFQLRKYYQPISLWNHINAHVQGSKPEKRWTKKEDETSLGVFLLRDLTGPSKMLGHFSWGLQAWCIKKIPRQKCYVKNNFLVIYVLRCLKFGRFKKNIYFDFEVPVFIFKKDPSFFPSKHTCFLKLPSFTQEWEHGLRVCTVYKI